jgi:hypothetical protein
VCVPFPLPTNPGNQVCHTEHYNDPLCEVAKKVQNDLYKADQDVCVAARVTQDGLYKAEKDSCEAAKLAQNALYKADKDSCELAKTGGKVACEKAKSSALGLCLAENIHTGDLVWPMTVNLFRRALGENPLNPSSSLNLPLINRGSGLEGDANLSADVGLRIGQAMIKWDDVEDMSLLVQLIMSKLRFPTPESNRAVSTYVSLRPHSFGSYLGAYTQKFGADRNDMDNRITQGILSGWKPDAGVSPAYGALRWYHRPDVGANPQLAEMFQPILNRFVR